MFAAGANRGVAPPKVSVGRRLLTVKPPLGLRPEGADTFMVEPSAFAAALPESDPVGETGVCGAPAQLEIVSTPATSQPHRTILDIKQVLLIRGVQRKDRALQTAEHDTASRATMSGWEQTT
jgi:hypothetical protein